MCEVKFTTAVRGKFLYLHYEIETTIVRSWGNCTLSFPVNRKEVRKLLVSIGRNFPGEILLINRQLQQTLDGLTDDNNTNLAA